jgi:hypothetical protein
MLQLNVGFSNQVTVPKKGACLFIGDEVPELPRWRRAKVFEPGEHSINLLEKMSYKRACGIVDMFDAAFTRGDGTLTKDTGLEFIASSLERHPKTLEELVPEPDKKSSTGHVWAYGKVQKILRSPVLRSVFCKPTNFPFKKSTLVLARLNRAEFGDFECQMIGLALIAGYPGQIVVEDGDSYLRDGHVYLIREDRLKVGFRKLSTLKRRAPDLHDELLCIPDKGGSGATFEDAETLARYETQFGERSNEFAGLVEKAMRSKADG